MATKSKLAWAWHNLGETDLMCISPRRYSRFTKRVRVTLVKPRRKR